MSFLGITLATLQPSDKFRFDRDGLKPAFGEWISTSREWKRLLSGISSESSPEPSLTKNYIKTNIDLESLYPRLRLPSNWKSIKHREGLDIEDIVKDKVCAKLAREWQEYIDTKNGGKNENQKEGHVARDPRTRAEKLKHEGELVSLNGGLSTTASYYTIEHSSFGRPSVQHVSSSGSSNKRLTQNQQVTQNQPLQSTAVHSPVASTHTAQSAAVLDSSTSSQPASSQPASSQPASTQTAQSAAVLDSSTSSQPASIQPASSQPASSQPASIQPASSQPAQGTAVFDSLAKSQPVPNQAIQIPAAWTPASAAPSQSALNQTAQGAAWTPASAAPSQSALNQTAQGAAWTPAPAAPSQSALNQTAQSAAVWAPLARSQSVAQNQTIQNAAVFGSSAESQPVPNQAVQSPAVWTLPPAHVQEVQRQPIQSQPLQSPVAWTQSAHNRTAQNQPAPLQPSQTLPIRPIQSYTEQFTQPQTQIQSSSQLTQIRPVKEQTQDGLSQGQTAWPTHCQIQTQPPSSSQRIQVQALPTAIPLLTQPAQSQSSPAQQPFTQSQDPLNQNQTAAPSQWAQIPSQNQSNQSIDSSTPNPNQIQSLSTQAPLSQLESQPQVTPRHNPPLHTYDRTTAPQGLLPQAHIPFHYQSIEGQAAQVQNSQILPSQSRIESPQYQTQYTAQPVQDQPVQAQPVQSQPIQLHAPFEHQGPSVVQAQPVEPQPSQVSVQSQPAHTQNSQILLSQSRIESPQYQTQYTAQPVQAQPVQSQPIQPHAPLDYQDPSVVQAQSTNPQHPQIPFHSQISQPQMQAQSVQPHISLQHELPFSQTPTPMSESPKPSTMAFDSRIVPPLFFNSNLNPNHHLHPYLQNPSTLFPNHLQNANPQPVQPTFTLSSTEAANLSLDTIQAIIDAFDRDIEALNRLN
ncbi:hypothetical protein BELL_0852g00010 [Botrytis elliptica]|uniref:Uncharacterized protein n=1 Tax=Botrytis elliptica TaxID=278938 RepID=A0A4Z1J2Z4_9HELO|nr:hypothetical protein BELL_0852g00010 [Botrytis elliptica]